MPSNTTTVAGQVYVTCTSRHSLMSTKAECQQNSAVRNAETQLVLVFCSVFWLLVRWLASILKLNMSDTALCSSQYTVGTVNYISMQPLHLCKGVTTLYQIQRSQLRGLEL